MERQMEENVRTWVWFFSVITAMTVGPILLGTLVIFGMMQAYRRYGVLMGEKLKRLRKAALSGLHMPVIKPRYSRPS